MPLGKFRGPCAEATVGESSLPRRDGVGRARRPPMGMWRWGLLRGVACLGAGASGGVWCAGRLPAASLGDGVLIWMPRHVR